MKVCSRRGDAANRDGVLQIPAASRRRLPVQERAFSLVEILVAVSLLAVIMLGLLAMFYQTQRAFRLGSAQADVAESGRATMQMLTSELKQMVPSPEWNVPGLITTNPYGPPLLQWRHFSPEPQENYLKEIFFVMRENDRWEARGFFVDPLLPTGGAGVLRRFSMSLPVGTMHAFSNAFHRFKTADPETLPRLTDRVIHLNFYSFDRDGYPWLGNGSQTNQNEIDFQMNQMPAYLEMELGILEPKVYERFRALTNNPQAAINYITSRVEQVHLFRQRIPIRNVHETLF